MSDLPGGRALVIGINTYQHGISPLQSASADARAIAQVLDKHHGYDVTLLLDDQASASAITTTLGEQATQLTDAARPFLLYFAGHGVARGDGEDGPQGYLLPQDAQPGDADTWVSMVSVRRALEALPCRHLLVVLDCCFAGAFRWAATRDVGWDTEPLYASQYERFLKGTAWQALTSASHEEKALDVIPGSSNTRDDVLEGNHSPFAAALLRGLAGDADTARANAAADGVITATELFQFTYDSLVPADAASHQTPGIWPLRNDNSGQFIFRNPAVPLNTREDPPLTDDANPWLGLRTYTRDDKALFFGRERVVEALYELVTQAHTSFLAVVGASGTGKSSVVRAGLIPRLTDGTRGDGTWRLVKMPRLGPEPVQQLQAVTEQLQDTPDAAPSVLLIDQFEELYTQCPDDARRLEFLKRLRTLIDQPGSPFVIITLRTDFEPRPRAAGPLEDIWDQARYVVPAFTMQEMREVITGPAHAMALFFEPDKLVETLLQEVMAMPGALPLLSFALAEMYRCAQRRRRADGDNDRALTQADYDSAGGVVGALHRRANRVYAEAKNEEERAAIRTLFLRMISTEAGLTRRRVHRSELVFTGARRSHVDHMIQTFTEARLLVSDGDYIEPAHDTLVVAWDKLQDWLAASDAQELIRATWRAAQVWQEQRQQADADLYLWHDDPRLAQLSAKVEQLNKIECDFVVASEALKERNRRRRRWVVAAVGVTLAAAAVFSAFQAKVAKREARTAQEQYQEARYANGRTMMAQARQSLSDKFYVDAALTSARVLAFKGYGAASNDAAQGDDSGEPLFDLFDGEYMELVGILTQANATPFRPVARRPLSFARLAQSRPRLVGLAQDGRGERWDLDRGSLTSFELPPLSDMADDLTTALSRDGSHLAVLSNDTGSVWLVDMDKPDQRHRLALPQQTDLFALRFNADATRLAGAGRTGIVIWQLDETTGRPTGEPTTVRASSFEPSTLLFRPDGQSLLIGGEKRNVLDPNGPLLLVRFDGQCAQAGLQLDEGDPCTAFVGPRSDMLIVEQTGRYNGRLDFARAIGFDRAGDLVALGSLNRVFVGATGDTYQSYDDVTTLLTTEGLVTALAFSPDGRALAVASANQLEIVEVRSGRVLARVRPDIADVDTSLRLSFSADGRLLLYAGWGHMTLFDTSFLSALQPAQSTGTDDGPVPLTTDDLDAAEKQLRQYWAQTTTNYDNLRTTTLFDRAEFDGEFTSDVVRDANQLWLDFGNGKRTAVALQPAPGNLLAMAVDSGGYIGINATVNVYHRATAALERSFTTAHDTITKMAFDSTTNTLIAIAKFYDGNESTLYRWSLIPPDLATLEASDPVCMAPVNVPPGSVLEGKSVLDCPP